MNRRGFFSALAAIAATAAVDPEKLLWVPGKKLISIPKPSLSNWTVEFSEPYEYVSPRVRIGDLIEMAMRDLKTATTAPNFSPRGAADALAFMNRLIDNWNSGPSPWETSGIAEAICRHRQIQLNHTPKVSLRCPAKGDGRSVPSA